MQMQSCHTIFFMDVKKPKPDTDDGLSLPTSRGTEVRKSRESML